MNPWEMVWNVVTGKEEQVKPVEQPKADYLDRLSMAESGNRAEIKSDTSSAVGHHRHTHHSRGAPSSEHGWDGRAQGCSPHEHSGRDGDAQRGSR